MNEREVLNFNPFDSDYGSPNDVRLQDKIVTNRKDHICTYCGQTSRKGEKSRIIADVFDGEFGKYRYCQKCCEAMEAWEVDGDFETYEERRKLNKA